MAKKDSSMIDLGKTPPDIKEVSVASDSKKTYYPSFFIRDVKGLDGLPKKGEFSFTGTGQLVSYSENLKDGTCTCEIEVHSIKPEDTGAKDSGDSLGDSLDAISASKDDENPAEEDAADEEYD